MTLLLLTGCIFGSPFRYDRNHDHPPRFDTDDTSAWDTADTAIDTADSGDTADTSDTSDTSDTADTGDTGPVYTATGGTVVAWGAGGVFASDADGRVFTQLTDVQPDGVNTGGGLVTARFGATAVAYDPTTGSASLTFTFTCPGGGELLDALLVSGAAYGICEDGLGARVVLGAFDGSTSDPGVWASALQWDAGTLYLYDNLGREGSQLHAVDPMTLAATGPVVSTGFQAEARGEGFFASAGELGNDTAGTVLVGSWADVGAQTATVLPDGVFVNALDVLEGRATLVATLTWPGLDEGALLLDADGAVASTLGACATPRLLSRESGYVESWCTAPLSRTTWTSDGGVWNAAETEVYDTLDVSGIRVIESAD